LDQNPDKHGGQLLGVFGFLRVEFILGVNGVEALLVGLNLRHQDVFELVTVEVVGVVRRGAMQPLVESTKAGSDQLSSGAVERAKEPLALGFKEGTCAHRGKPFATRALRWADGCRELDEVLRKSLGVS
jgi:hypothetical protein